MADHYASLERQDRLAIGRARARYRDAIRQLDLALERGHDEREACLRVGAATIMGRDGHDACRRLFLAMDKREFGGVEAARPEDKQSCEHHDTHFDRTICACGAMHDYCNDCGKALLCPLDENAQPPWDETQEGVEANTPEDLPVPANADKRYPEMDGG